MKPLSQNPVSEDLQQQRESVRRGLRRTNAAAILILGVVIALALVAIVQANRTEQERARAERERLRAVEAETDAREKLWHSYLAQARAGRVSGRAGQRFDSLEAIRHAAVMRPSLELRNEAIACLTLADLRLIQPRFISADARVSVDAEMERYAMADKNGIIEVRAVTNDHVLSRLRAQTNSVTFIHHFSPNSQFLSVLYQDGLVRIWNLARHEIAVSFRPEDDIHSLDFSPGSRTLVAVDSARSVVLYDLSSGKILKKESAWLQRLRPRFSPEGSRLAFVSPSSRTVRIVDAEDRRVLMELPHPAGATGVRALDWSPDGHLVATAGNDGNVYLWRPPNPQPIFVLSGHQSAATALAFHPHGQLLASASWDGTTRLWDVARGEMLVTLPANGTPLRFSRDGRYLTFYGGKNKSLQVCEVAAERLCRFLSPRTLTGKDKGATERMQWCVAFSPDGALLVSSYQDGWRLWNVEKELEIAHVPGRSFPSVLFHPDGQSVIACGDEGVLSWSLETVLAGVETNLPPPRSLAKSGALHRACISTGGEELAYIRSPNVNLLDANRQLDGLPGLTFIAMSRDRRWLAASAWYQNGGRLWELPSGNRVRDFARGQTVTVGFSPDNRWLITGEGDAYRFWDVETGRPGRTIATPQNAGSTGAAAFSPDSKTYACVLSRTHAQLLDAERFEPLAVLEPPAMQMITWLAFNPSGTRLAMATFTPFIQLWDVGLMRQELAKLGLDWEKDVPSLTYPVRGATDQVGRDTRHLTSDASNRRVSLGTSIWIPLSGVVLAICLAVFVLKRQQKLVASYRQIDELAVQRSQELEATQTALLHGEKMRALGTLAAGIAHDFNNLLSVIRMANHLVERAVRPDSVTKENVDAIEHAVVEGQQIVRSMLGYSREAADERRSFSVGALVGDTVALLSKQFLSGIALTLELDPKTPPVAGSTARLEQILLNLIVNAAEAMNGQGKLRIRVQPADSAHGCLLAPRLAARYVELAVADLGPGIPADILPRIFEPFFTTKTKGATHGTGLGLSTVYTIAQQDGLGLGVESEVGMGSIFRVLIPVDEAVKREADTPLLRCDD